MREAVAALRGGDLAALGALLDASHASLRELYEISTPAVEATVARLREAGAAGARLVGGGFGGAVLGAVRARRRAAARARSRCAPVPARTSSPRSSRRALRRAARRSQTRGEHARRPSATIASDSAASAAVERAQQPRER